MVAPSFERAGLKLTVQSAETLSKLDFKERCKWLKDLKDAIKNEKMDDFKKQHGEFEVTGKRLGFIARAWKSFRLSVKALTDFITNAKAEIEKAAKGGKGETVKPAPQNPGKTGEEAAKDVVNGQDEVVKPAPKVSGNVTDEAAKKAAQDAKDAAEERAELDKWIAQHKKDIKKAQDAQAAVARAAAAKADKAIAVSKSKCDGSEAILRQIAP